MIEMETKRRKMEVFFVAFSRLRKTMWRRKMRRWREVKV